MEILNISLLDCCKKNSLILETFPYYLGRIISTCMVERNAKYLPDLRGVKFALGKKKKIILVFTHTPMCVCTRCQNIGLELPQATGQPL